MTRIKFIYDNNIIIGFNMKGHAEFNLDGPDILCASLSTASQMTINGIIDWTGLDEHDVVIHEDEALGELEVMIPRPHHNSITVQQLLKSFVLFVEQLEEQYCKNIKIER